MDTATQQQVITTENSNVPAASDVSSTRPDDQQTTITDPVEDDADKQDDDVGEIQKHGTNSAPVTEDTQSPEEITTEQKSGIPTNDHTTEEPVHQKDNDNRTPSTSSTPTTKRKVPDGPDDNDKGEDGEMTAVASKKQRTMVDTVPPRRRVMLPRAAKRKRDVESDEQSNNPPSASQRKPIRPIPRVDSVLSASNEDVLPANAPLPPPINRIVTNQSDEIKTKVVESHTTPTVAVTATAAQDVRVVPDQGNGEDDKSSSSSDDDDGKQAPEAQSSNGNKDQTPAPTVSAASTNVAPLHCPNCNQKFTRQDNCDRHYKSNVCQREVKKAPEGPFICDTCKIEIGRHSDFKRHQKLDCTKYVICMYCKSVLRKGLENLARHLRYQCNKKDEFIHDVQEHVSDGHLDVDQNKWTWRKDNDFHIPKDDEEVRKTYLNLAVQKGNMTEQRVQELKNSFSSNK